MDPDEVFVLCIIALVMAAGVARSWVRARHGLPERKRGRGALAAAMPADAIDADRKIRLLSDENATLAGKVSRLEERIAVLERIATDPAERTAREIDALRDR